MFKKAVFLSVALVSTSSLVLTLSGCGGGGGGGAVAASAPVLPAYYVDPATGNDTNAGTQAAPFKTLTMAINAASAVAAAGGANIYAASGVYNAAGGEVFPLMPTTGENLIGTGIALIEGFANYTVAGGERVGANIGTSFVFASGVAASLTGFGASGVEPTVVVADNATVTLKDNNFLYDPNGSVYSAYPLWLVNGSTVTVTNNTISGWVALDTADAATKVIARGNHFDGGYTICTADYTPTASQLDLGTAASPGNNTILRSGSGQAGLNSWAQGTAYAGGIASEVGITAVGNTWIANQQGADANGHYAASSVVGGTAEATAGPNYNVLQPAGIQF